MNQRIVIGGGMCGLIAAWSLKHRYPDSQVTLLERAPELGGLLSGAYYPAQDLYFDQGTHIFQETGNPGIDGFIRHAIPPESLILLPDDASDLAGAVFDGRLQSNSHFPDIRTRADYGSLLEAVKEQVANRNFTAEFRRDEPLVAVARRRFGHKYTDTLLAPMLSSIFQIEPEALAAFALLLPGLTRIVALNETDWLQAAPSPASRAVFASPDQRRLPLPFRHGRRSFYTKNRGARGVIDALETQLLIQGVCIKKNAVISELDASGMVLKYTTNNQLPKVIHPDSIYIATGVMGAAKLLNLETRDFGLERPLLHRVVHLLLNRPVDSDLHYIYGLDAATSFYRITHYGGFSSSSSDCRLTVEVLGRANIPDKGLPELLLRQMQAVGFLQSQTPVFSDVQKLNNGFPSPTINNLNGLERLKKHVLPLLHGQVQLGGAGSADGVFFTNETMVNSHATIQAATPDLA